MSRAIATAIFTAMLVAAMPMAYGQTNSAGQSGSTGSAATSGVSATQVQPGQLRASNLMGSKVYDKQGNDIGTIKDMIVDGDGKVAAVVLDVGSGKYVAVNMNQIKTSIDKNNKVQYSLDMSKDQVKSLQAYNLNQAPSGTAGTSTPASSSK